MKNSARARTIAAYVAANVDRTADGQLAGARVVDVLAAMGSDLTTMPVDDGVAYVIDGRAPSFYPADSPPPDVGTALGFDLAPPGPRRIREGWFSIVASHRAADPPRSCLGGGELRGR